MKRKRYCFALLIASFLSISISRPSKAVSLVYDISSVDFSEKEYIFTSGFGYYAGKVKIGYYAGKVKIENNIFLQPGGTRGLKRLIQQKFPNLTIVEAPTLPNDPFSSLTGQFKISQYYACPPSPITQCRDQSFLSVVGATMTVEYIPSEGDPVQGRVIADSIANSPSLRIGWLHRVKNNHAIDGDYGELEDVLDLDQDGNPFYAFTSMENRPVKFDDTPNRIYPDKPHWWQGELYLATNLTGTNVYTIYDGFRWGWSNTARRIEDPCILCSDSGGNDADNDPPPPSDPPVGLCGYSTEPDVRWPCDRGPITASLSARSSLAQEFSSRPSEVTAVPEPTSAVAVLAIGTWLGVSWRKRKSEKQLAEGNIT